MVDPTKLPQGELERARDLGAATYCAAYIRLMMRELGISDRDTGAVNDMMLKMIGPMNAATDAIWRALMEDHKGMRDALQHFEAELTKI